MPEPLIRWHDPTEWMEKMRGPRWHTRLAAENRAFEAAVAAAAGKENTEAILTSFQASKEAEEAAVEWTVGNGAIRIIPQAGNAIAWHWRDEPATAVDRHPLVGAIALGPGPRGLLYSVEIGGGAERYEIVGERAGRRIWTYRPKHGTGSDLAVIGEHVYFLEAESPLRFSRLVRLEVATGRRRQLLYEEPNRSVALTLVRGENGCLFLLRENAGRQALCWVHEGKVRPLTPDGVLFVPIGARRRGGPPVYLVCRGSIDAPWEGVGFEIPEPLKREGIAGAHLGSGILISRIQGGLTGFSKGVHWLGTVLGEVSWNSSALWEGRFEMAVSIPGQVDREVTVHRDRVRIAPARSVYAANRMTGQTQSADGTDVRWITVSSVQAPTKLLVIAYGAYGIPTHLSTTRWRPFLERGWAIGWALVRGGGDWTPGWAEAGRRDGKLRGVEDLEACTREMQRALGISPRATCLFGRSAGGYLVGAAVVRNPDGLLFRTVYTEVPYVDILKTASNPKLPLTEYEFLEFGNPMRSISDFETILRLAPVQGLGPKGAPGVAVLCRTALNDRQVYAYESVKWMDALRGKGRGAGAGRPKLLAVRGGAGHFSQGDRLFQERTEDLLILEKLVKE
jgi:protease II